MTATLRLDYEVHLCIEGSYLGQRSMRTSRPAVLNTQTRQSGVGGVVLEENLVEIGLIIAEIFLFVKCDLDLHFKCSLM